MRMKCELGLGRACQRRRLGQVGASRLALVVALFRVAAACAIGGIVWRVGEDVASHVCGPEAGGVAVWSAVRSHRVEGPG